MNRLNRADLTSAGILHPSRDIYGEHSEGKVPTSDLTFYLLNALSTRDPFDPLIRVPYDVL